MEKKWSKKHTCRSGKAYIMIKEYDHDESLSHESEQDGVEHSEEDNEAKISLNAMSGV